MLGEHHHGVLSSFFGGDVDEAVEREAGLQGDPRLSPEDDETRLESGFRVSEAEGEGFEPSIRLTTDNGFRDRRIRPLCHPSDRATGYPFRGAVLVVDAGDHVLAPQHADAMRRAGEAHLEAGVAREEHLVAGLERASRPGRRPRRCRCGLRGLVRRHDQAARQLRLVDRLEDDVVVERLERHVGHGMPFQHGLHDTRCMRLGRYDVPVTNPDKLVLPRARADEGRPRRVLRRASRTAHSPTSAAGRST